MAGLQILKRTRQVSTQLVEAYKGLPVANISDCMSRWRRPALGCAPCTGAATSPVPR